MLEDDVRGLVERVVDGDELAWQRLWQMVEPRLYGALRRPSFLGKLSDSEDECRNIIVEVMARLRADGSARLGLWLDNRRDGGGPPFIPWLMVVAKRVAIDYMRGHEAFRDRRKEPNASSPGAWQVLDTLVPDSRGLGARPPVTDRASAAEIIELARRELPEAQQAALAAWLEGHDLAEIAGLLAVPDARAAERVVRAAVERLRRRFRGGVS